MFTLTSFAVALGVASSVSGLVVPRASPPPGWATKILEPYDTYHTRYLAIGCKTKHNTRFFDQCCHPLLANQKLSSRPSQCTPSASSTSSAPAVTTSSPTLDDEYDDCDDEDYEDDESPVVVSSSKAPIAATTKAPAVATTKAPTVTTTKAPAVTTTKAPVVTTTKPAAAKPTTSKTSTVKPSPTSTPKSQVASTSGNSGGFATYFYQNGVAGACGTVHKDTDLIAAMDGRRYGNLNVKSALCGKKVKITNPKNNKSVTVTIADACPTCENSNSIDLSEGAFKQIATLDQGLVGINWSFI
ncbi:Papain inhibitor [Hypsizygus marmoreus]|uniref:Papain inhibitor n=1 Tax=Hypsizygus marmoreus TaxID=39966 RepID=A0A369JL35_HYPMA|nr:Papain inhibitor [Hypsizygus marmoreus]